MRSTLVEFNLIWFIYYRINDLKFSAIGLQLILTKRLKKKGTTRKMKLEPIEVELGWYAWPKFSKCFQDPRIHEIRSISSTSSKMSHSSLLKYFEFCHLVIGHSWWWWWCDEKLFLEMIGWWNTLNIIFNRDHCWKVLCIAKLVDDAKRNLTCAEREFRFCWMKLHSSGNRYTIVSNKKKPSKYFCFI